MVRIRFTIFFIGGIQVLKKNYTVTGLYNYMESEGANTLPCPSPREVSPPAISHETPIRLRLEDRSVSRIIIGQFAR